VAELILPQLGVRLGKVAADYVELSAGDLMYYDKANGIALIPVVERTASRAAGSYRLHRRQAPDDDATVTGADIGPSIVLVKATETSANAANAGHSALDIRHYRAHAPRKLWDGAQGVLVLLLYEVDIESPDSISTIAAGIAAVLADQDQDPLRCIVPSTAIGQAEDNPSLSAAQPALRPAMERRTAKALDTPAVTALCFAFGSCQYTSGIVDGTPQIGGLVPGPADQSYARLAARLKRSEPSERPQLLVLAGDQVYVDATAGLFDPATADGRFRRPYEQFFSSPFVQEIRRQIQICMMLDDHEIDDNFENDDDAARQLLKPGRASYIEFQRDVGPLPTAMPRARNRQRMWLRDPKKKRLKWPADVDQGLSCAVTLRGYDFFFVDSRTERQKRTAQDFDRKHMLGRRQMIELLQWLDKDNPDGRPRFVVSPSILLPRRLSTLEHPATALLSDAWDGYPRSQRLLLRWMARRRISDVVFLSGDEHRCCTASATFDSTDPPIVVRSIHCSGMYAPFPFANSIPEDFARKETLRVYAPFPFANSSLEATKPGQAPKLKPERTWAVTSKFFPPGQGFGVIHVQPEPDRWTVRVTFDLDSGESTDSFSFQRPSPTARKRAIWPRIGRKRDEDRWRTRGA